MNLTGKENVTGVTGFARFLQPPQFSVINFNGFSLKSPILDVFWFQNSHLTLNLTSDLTFFVSARCEQIPLMD